MGKKIYIDDPLSVLNSLRYKADQKVFSSDEPGVLIWLRQSIPKEKKKCGYGFITHCCYADDSCDYHKQIEININKSLKN